MAPNLTLYFLQASRCIRTAWQLEEMKLNYTLAFSDKENGVAPQHFKGNSGDALGKFPLLRDGDVTVGESGAIAEYLCDNYDTEKRLLPSDRAGRAQVQRWVHAAEATYLLHACAILYTRGFGKGQYDDATRAITKGMSVNVLNDMDFLEGELARGDGRFLVGDSVTIADCMMLFSIQIIISKELGTEGRKWERVERWMKDCEGTESYQMAVKKTGHKL